MQASSYYTKSLTKTVNHKYYYKSDMSLSTEPNVWHGACSHTGLVSQCMLNKNGSKDVVGLSHTTLWGKCDH